MRNILFCLLITTYSFAQSDSTETLKMLFVGDIMGHGPQIKSAYDATTKTYNYDECFKYVAPIIKDADLAVGNLEVTLPGKPPYKGYPMFRSPDALADAIHRAGFDVMVTSNNHSNDAGKLGVTHTIDVLKNLGLYQTGTFKNQAEKDAYYPLIVYKKGFRLAVLNYTYDTNGMPTIAPTVVNLIEEDEIKKDIKFAQKLKPDAIIVVMHWGLEYQLNESPVQKKLTEQMFQWGADLIIGAHPHVIQPIKKMTYKDSDGNSKEGLVVYSLGNFISNQKQKNTDGGLMVEIELTKKVGSNKAKVTDHKYIPVWRYVDKVNAKNKYGTYRALPIAAFEKDKSNVLKMPASSIQKMKSFGTKMRKHLNKHGGVERDITLDEIGLIPMTGYKESTPKNPYAKLVNQKDSLPFKRIIPLQDVGHPVATPPTTVEPENVEKKPVPKDNIGNRPLPGGNRFPPNKEITEPEEVNIPPPNPTTNDNNTTAEYDPKNTKFRIQFQTGKNLYNTAKMPFDYVTVEEANGLFKYFTPAGNTIKQAKATLKTVQVKGFVDAFITSNPNFIETGIKGGDVEEEEVNYPQGKYYKVQFQSSKKIFLSNSTPFEDIQVVEVKGWYRYYTGEATTLEAAQALLQTVQDNGYKDAFLVPFMAGKPVL